MMASMENKILAGFKSVLEELAFLNYVEYERIRSNLSEFQPHEMPGVQIFDDGELYRHQRLLVETQWSVIVELFQAANPDGSHNAALLYDRKYEIERKIGENLKLNIPAVADDGSLIEVQYVDSTTNLFMVNGISIAQLRFKPLFLKPYSGVC
jgi:hypothetical protein